MKVRVKEGHKGFIYGSLRNEGDTFTIVPVKHSTEVDDNGKLVVISVDQQFSNVWMEKVKSPGRPAGTSSGDD